jgi:hypothetical protein
LGFLADPGQATRFLGGVYPKISGLFTFLGFIAESENNSNRVSCEEIKHLPDIG